VRNIRNKFASIAKSAALAFPAAPRYGAGKRSGESLSFLAFLLKMRYLPTDSSNSRQEKPKDRQHSRNETVREPQLVVESGSLRDPPLRKETGGKDKEEMMSTNAATLTSLGTVVLDPGHGGTQEVGSSSPNNAISVSGVKEKKLTLDFCLILRDGLVKAAATKNKQINVILTRTADVNVGIKARANVAATNKADLFLCLHFNGSNQDKNLRGVETFFRAASNGNLNLDDDMDFANVVNKSLFESLKSIDGNAKNRGVKPDTQSGPGKLGVMNDNSLGNQNRPKKCRSCYVELEYITNPAVETLLISGPEAAQNRELVMGNLAKAMADYLETI
jgi:N-acetylmuramoyl-L-alanine amidase